MDCPELHQMELEQIIYFEEVGFKEGVCMWGYEEGTRGKSDWIQYSGTKKSLSRGRRRKGRSRLKLSPPVNCPELRCPMHPFIIIGYYRIHSSET